jgi:hypothetical protein
MHVLCAVAIYAFWWHKPMDVRYPVILHIEPVLAAKIYGSFDGSRDYAAPPFETRSNEPCLETIPAESEESEAQNDTLPKEDAPPARTDTKYPDRLEANRVLTRVRRILEIGEYSLFNFYGWRDSFCLWQPTSDAAGRKRWQGYDARAKGAFRLDPEDLGLDDASSRENACARANMVLREGSVRIEDDKEGSWLVLVAFSVAYGGAHASAWNSHMPSPLERLLWRVSSVTVATGIPLALGVYFCSRRLARYWDATKRQGTLGKVVKWLGRKDTFISAVLLGFCLPLILLVLVARAFVVTESFISLRSLEKGSFDVVIWSNYWPHF